MPDVHHHLEASPCRGVSVFLFSTPPFCSTVPDFTNVSVIVLRGDDTPVRADCITWTTVQSGSGCLAFLTDTGDTRKKNPAP